VAEIVAQQKVPAGNRFQPAGATIAASSSARPQRAAGAGCTRAAGAGSGVSRGRLARRWSTEAGSTSAGWIPNSGEQGRTTY